jgi:hypothetical protein
MNFKVALIFVALAALMTAAPTATPTTAPTKYINYDAIAADFTNCSKKGTSAANCKTEAQANPYNRGCNAISQCRSDEASC